MNICKLLHIMNFQHKSLLYADLVFKKHFLLLSVLETTALVNILVEIMIFISRIL